MLPLVWGPVKIDNFLHDRQNGPANLIHLRGVVGVHLPERSPNLAVRLACDEDQGQTL